MAKQYSITINNKASHSAYFMLFQGSPGEWDRDAMALAWFAKFSNPNSKVQFKWALDIGLSWAETGALAPGVQYVASELYDPTGSMNMITLDYNGAYMFSNPRKGPDPDRIYLQESANVPVGSLAAVGITMSGSTVYAVQARPNQNLTFSPRPSYYLAYGQYEEGSVIDVSTVNNALALEYPTGVYALETTLNADSSWTPPRSLPQANAEVVQLRKAA